MNKIFGKQDSAMLQDFDGEMTSSKRQSAKDFLHDLNRLRDQSSHSDVLRLCDGYVQRKVLPLENVYMAKVSRVSWMCCVGL